MTPALAPWQLRLLRQAIDAYVQGRLGHGMLLTGPAHLGKKAVAEALAQRILCQAPGPEGFACGACRSCHQFAAQTVGLLVTQTHGDLQRVGLEPNDKGDKLRNDIVVEQIRKLGHWFALSAQFGGAKVAVIEPADLLNSAAGNALLKTLEEPAPNRFLLLVSSRPGRLPATIRSRCQRLEFRVPPADEAIAFLRAQGVSANDATEALTAARGNPGQAAYWLREGGLRIRSDVLKALESLRDGRASPIELAQAWLADEHAALRLRFAAELALDAGARGLGALDPVRAAVPGLTPPANFPKLSVWFDGINRLREQLGAPLRHDLVLAGLLLDWRTLYDAAGGSRASGRRTG